MLGFICRELVKRSGSQAGLRSAGPTSSPVRLSPRVPLCAVGYKAGGEEPHPAMLQAQNTRAFLIPGPRTLWGVDWSLLSVPGHVCPSAALLHKWQ